MIELFTNPLLYVASTTLCVLGLAHEWKSERSVSLLRGTLALALAGNAIMLGVTVAS